MNIENTTSINSARSGATQLVALAAGLLIAVSAAVGIVAAEERDAPPAAVRASAVRNESVRAPARQERSVHYIVANEAERDALLERVLGEATLSVLLAGSPEAEVLLKSAGSAFWDSVSFEIIDLSLRR